MPAPSPAAATASGATTEAEPLPDGVASPAPPLFYASMWIAVFAVLIWGFQVLMGSRRSVPPE